MAINVNTVYTTVLSILNKEQRGYITPDEFNKLAAQVQLEIFENYFEDYNQLLRIPQTDTEYVNRQKNINTAISIFKQFGVTTTVPTGFVTLLNITTAGVGYVSATNSATTGGSGNGLTVNVEPVTPGFVIGNAGIGYTNGINVPTTTGGAGNGLTVNINSVSGGGAITGLTINNPGTGYVNGNEVLNIIQAGSTTTATIQLTSPSIGAIQNIIINNGGSGYVVGDVVNIAGANPTFATATIDSVNSALYFLPPSNTHRIGTVIFKDKEIQRVDRNELLYLNLSPITKPSKTFPIYTYEQALVNLSTMSSAIIGCGCRVVT